MRWPNRRPAHYPLVAPRLRAMPLAARRRIDPDTLRDMVEDPEELSGWLDAADACATAAAVAVELHRLVPAAHAALRATVGPILAPAQPDGFVLVDCRTLLLAGAAPAAAVRAIERHHGDVLDGALAGLAERGWLILGGGTIAATERCRDLLAAMQAAADRELSRLWGEPAALLATLEALVTAGRGTSAGEAFDPLAAAGHPGGGTVAGR